MTGIIIVAHDELSDAIVRTANMIFGNTENVVAVNFKPGEGIESLAEKIESAYNLLTGCDGVVIMTDIFGGTPMNASLLMGSKHKNVELISGVNVPMVLEALNNRDKEPSEVVKIAENAGSNGVKIVSLNKKV